MAYNVVDLFTSNGNFVPEQVANVPYLGPDSYHFDIAHHLGTNFNSLALSSYTNQSGVSISLSNTYTNPQNSLFRNATNNNTTTAFSLGSATTAQFSLTFLQDLVVNLEGVAFGCQRSVGGVLNSFDIQGSNDGLVWTNLSEVRDFVTNYSVPNDSTVRKYYVPCELYRKDFFSIIRISVLSQTILTSNSLYGLYLFGKIKRINGNTSPVQRTDTDSFSNRIKNLSDVEFSPDNRLNRLLSWSSSSGKWVAKTVEEYRRTETLVCNTLSTSLSTVPYDILYEVSHTTLSSYNVILPTLNLYEGQTVIVRNTDPYTKTVRIYEDSSLVGPIELFLKNQASFTWDGTEWQVFFGI